jgi:SpoVK/Ycf46/Vps4 family AAA+-type ATPase
VTVEHYLEHVASEDEKKPVVELQDFIEALSQLTPSVSPADLKRYGELQQKYK